MPFFIFSASVHLLHQQSMLWRFGMPSHLRDPSLDKHFNLCVDKSAIKFQHTSKKSPFLTRLKRVQCSVEDIHLLKFWFCVAAIAKQCRTQKSYRTYRKIRITKCSKDTFNDSYPPVMVSLTFPGTSTRYHAMTPPTNIWVCTSARRLTRTKQGPFWFVITYMARCTSKSPSVHGEDSCDVRCSIEQLTHE
jgi:hypothetical protein